jgi:geranylgeranyl pyrophosphate synthase
MVALNQLSLDPLVAALREFAPLSSRMEPHLEAAVLQSTGETGKLIRARLTHEAAREHGLGETEALQLACAVEYFHTASLILDDLPCMDDADTRRGSPCVHRVHGDATATLAALALINRAYVLAGFAFMDQPAAVRWQAMVCVDGCLGAAGLVGGQAADLRFGETGGGAREVGRIAAAKTGALFWLAVFLPALAAQADAAERRDLKALCVYWGLAFQGMDDLVDLMKTTREAGKSTGRDSRLARPNLAIVMGAAAARRRVARLARLSEAATERLAARGKRWGYLQRFQAECFAVARQRTEAALEAVAA